MRSTPANLILQLCIFAGIVVVIGLLVLLIVKQLQVKYPYAAESQVAYRMELISEAVLKTINGIVITDVEGKIVFWNMGAEKLFGWKESEVLGKTLSFIMTEETYKRHEEGMKRMQFAGGMKNFDRTFEQIALHRFGEEIPVAINISESTIKGVVHYTGIIKNIRERKEREELHMMELALLNEGEKVGGFGTWSWDIATNKVTCTENFNVLFETEDMVTTVEYLMKRVYYQDRDALQQLLSQALKNKTDYETNYRISKLSGEPAWINCKAEMRIRENGTLFKIIGVIRKLDDKA